MTCALNPSQVSVEGLLRQYGGGGHKGAGTCRPKKEEADRVLKEIVEACRV